MKKHKIATFVLIIVLLFGILIIFVDYPDKKDTNQKNIKPVQIANPASVNCKELGGSLKMMTLKDGGQYGLCYFDDNKACEEWALFRGDCPKGGVKTTGYDTIDQKYCAWRGGITKAEKDSECLFRNGNKCRTIDYYNGTCSDN